MVDVLLLAMLVAFFVIAVLFVRGCEWIIGPDVEATRAEPVETSEAA
jgi:hypothetical protein